MSINNTRVCLRITKIIPKYQTDNCNFERKMKCNIKGHTCIRKLTYTYVDKMLLSMMLTKTN